MSEIDWRLALANNLLRRHDYEALDLCEDSPVESWRFHRLLARSCEWCHWRTQSQILHSFNLFHTPMANFSQIRATMRTSEFWAGLRWYQSSMLALCIVSSRRPSSQIPTHHSDQRQVHQTNRTWLAVLCLTALLCWLKKSGIIPALTPNSLFVDQSI